MISGIQRYLEAQRQGGDAIQNYIYQKEQMINRYRDRLDEERLARKIAEYVAARIQVSANTKELAALVKELDRLLQMLQ